MLGLHTTSQVPTQVGSHIARVNIQSNINVARIGQS